ncbi:hypothetical protein LIN78_16185 [Leeia sp. TBRC 13508]|uniref:Uncharacterized protein n=1 Tax=Leeia speluncae TaxID=2884804 RepID=A0ABS8DAD1_9NEIS|nr:hypothetical protein [Leeia speluncae]MCB6185087.1 hypothetical protein [Leeia speluncae]
MSDYFAFRFSEPQNKARTSLAIFFVSNIRLDVISKALKMDVTENLVPKNVYLISLENCLITLPNCKADSTFASEFDSYVGDINQRLFCLSVDIDGKFKDCTGRAIEEDLSATLLHEGMDAIFKQRSGLVVSNHGYHFAKPSGDHCNSFIRASNLLVSGVEVAFLALSLLPFMRKDLKRIYVDSSSISYLISVAIQLYHNFDSGFPAIESFASYAVLNEQFDFVEDDSSLLFISATTSGSLANKLLNKTLFTNEQVITLFHVNLPPGQRGVFEVAAEVGEKLVSGKASDCEFCKQGSKLIRIAGDQFLPENPKHELLIIKKTDFNKDRQGFFRQFAAQNVLKWNIAVRSTEEFNEHFYIDVKEALALKLEPFWSELDKYVKRYLSRDLRTVIYFDDAGSQALKDKVKEYFTSEDNSVNWVKYGDLTEVMMKDASSVIVLVGAITSGRSLLAISRKLRCIHESSTITYLVAFSKMPNGDAFEQLRKDLSQGGHFLAVLNHCRMPRVKEYTKTAWDSERECLQPFGDDDPFGSDIKNLPDIFSGRLSLLVGNSFDSNNLFLPTSSGKVLTLRQTFAFWSDFGFDAKRLSKSTQADVYWTVQSVLHDLRNASENNGLATSYHTTLISPANFDRYNDGVIQSCLLRAARPVEMDYRVDHIFSRQMTDVILSVLRNWDNEQGEAALEFLMALWTQRLRVEDGHLREILEVKEDCMTDDLKFLFARLEEKLEPVQ